MFLQNRSVVFASSCHGGHGGGGTKQTGHSKHKKSYPQGEIIEIKAPPEITVKGTLTCPGKFLYVNKKGYGHDDKEKCKNSAIMVEKAGECGKSGKEECPYEGKLYHILLNEKAKELINSKKYRGAEISITGSLWPDERVIGVRSFRRLSAEEMETVHRD